MSTLFRSVVSFLGWMFGLLCLAVLLMHAKACEEDEAVCALSHLAADQPDFPAQGKPVAAPQASGACMDCESVIRLVPLPFTTGDGAPADLWT